MRNLPHHSTNPLQKLFVIVTTVAVVAVTLMFSAVVFAVLLVAGVLGWSYLWWKTREVRNMMRNRSAAAMEQRSAQEDAVGGIVIEGVAVRVDDKPEHK